MSMDRFIQYVACIGIALAICLIGMGIAKIVYTPTEKETGRVIEGAEKARHDRLMKKHGIRNTAVVYVHQDGSEWYYNHKQQYCRFK